MKSILTLASFVLLAFTMQSQTDLGSYIFQIEGNWVGLTGREMWTKVEDELVMEGISFYNVNYDEYGTNEMPNEHMVILSTDEGWVYIATPLDSDQPTTFKLTKATKTEWVFENPQHDFPKRITYRFVGSDQIEATIDGGPSSSQKPQVWKYWKKTL